MCQVKYLFLLHWWRLIQDPMNDKTEIYRLSYSVRIFKCFKWDVFNTIFSTKNETMLELFNFYDTLCPKYLTKMYLNQYKQNKNDCVNNNNGYNSKNNKNGDGNKIITIKITTTIKVIIINSLHVFQSGEFPAASTTTFYATMLYSILKSHRCSFNEYRISSNERRTFGHPHWNKRPPLISAAPLIVALIRIVTIFY